MKVSLWYNNKDIRITEVAMPVPGPSEMLIKVMACGICGSDIVEWYRLPRAPLVQGHELGAEVVQTGDAVTRFKPGDRVFIAPKVPCQKCRYCKQGHFPQCTDIKERLPGGFAEYVLVPETLIEHGAYLLPPSISFEQSTFIEPLGCVVRAQTLARVSDGQTVLILGCGMSGLLHVKLAKSRGARVIATDVNDYRLACARSMGADLALDSSVDLTAAIRADTGRLADVVILSTSAMPAVVQSWDCVDKGGTIVFFTVPGPDDIVTIPVNDLWIKGVTTRTSYYCGPPDLNEALGLISSGTIQVEDMITHRLPLDDIEKGFRLVTDGKESIKVMILPQVQGN